MWETGWDKKRYSFHRSAKEEKLFIWTWRNEGRLKVMPRFRGGDVYGFCDILESIVWKW